MPRSRRVSGAPSSEAGRTGRPRWGLRLFGVLSAAVLVVSGFGWAAVNHLDEGIERVDAFDGVQRRPQEREGVTFLLAGVDRRDEISRDERRKLHVGGEACNCTDALMLVHISADRSRVSVVSLPRDSYVSFPPHDEPDGTRNARHRGKINAAYSHGGPALTVATVERATGIHINHYLELDFLSFTRTVDALGGVEVCTMTPLKDEYAGLDLPAGTSTVDGSGALRYVRARHVGSLSDFGRMERQQHFFAQVMRKLSSSGVLANPARLTAAVDGILGSVRADRSLTSGDLVELGAAMRHFSLSGSEFVSVPVADEDYRGDPHWGSAVLWDQQRSRELFAKIREDRPLTSGRPGKKTRLVPIDPRSIRVQVINGSGRTGLGARTDGALRRSGFATTGLPRNGERDAQRTLITFDPRWDRSARSLAAALPGAQLRAVRGHGPVLDVTIGHEFQGVRRVKASTTGLAENPRGVRTGDQVLCP
ncbi:LytR family transcriptional regulator [Wenjunlia vitaminophila]|uniref:LytR family transcriptional regulator n=1 Tax=Wenjunlia vitaminophila TaxID=76728 RepID=A0A0T6LRL9_WENVI|nr:LCP family protein [Wenjunlia vitaminophila]KRV48733.1 LytR family transcriptional regulator [Wenjunlia vitaminophila]